MTEILITSSVLILALLVLRRVFREKISRRAQYALWLLVLARLLIPVSLPTAGFGVLSAAEPAVEAASSRLESRAVYVLPLDRAPAAEVPAASQTQPGQVVETGDSFGYPVLSSDGETVTRYARQLTASELLRYLWYGGMALTGLWFLAGNLRFRWKLRRRRRPYPVEGCPVPVYLAEGWLASPCLVGFLRPAIYLTPAAAAAEERQRHVIAHELTHRRHLDPLWSLLRSVCLVVYWFDPLVWAAALASRTDGELACDEAVLAGLDQEERLAYGRSLLALVPVRRTGGDPFLTATTMASGKRQMKDRIGRIAQARRTTALALTLALVLAAVTCAATFTAPAGAEDDGSGTAPLTGSDDPLTGAELTYFAEEWFNGDDFNIRNQFLNSLYDRPEDIDLYNLFYCGSGLPETISDQELAEEGNWAADGELICPLEKNSRANMDAVLTQYAGLTVEETNQVGLEGFSYREEYDAWYHAHGDTNYYPQVDITAGRRQGDLIHLYYRETFRPDRGDWGCVTLRDLGDGNYWFVSNQISEKPAIPTVYPAEGLELTMPLAEAEVWPLEAAEIVRHSGDCAEELSGWLVNDRSVNLYLSTDGNLYAALMAAQSPAGSDKKVWEADVFLTIPDGAESADVAVSFFHDLFGYNGLVISYDDFTDYWAIPVEGGPILLARAPGEAAVIDLDGNGVDELTYADYGGAHLWFLDAGGQLRHVDVSALLEEQWPTSAYTRFRSWDTLGRCLPLNGVVPLPGSDAAIGTAFRDLYFDGENLLLYRDTRTQTDHVLEGVSAPADVLDAAKAVATEVIEQGMDYLPDTDGGYDDWHIESVEGPWALTAGDLELEIWRFNYEWHATDPANVVLAGGRYITEDGWVSPGYPGCDYLYFLLDGDGGRTYLYTRMENDCMPGTEPFFADMVRDLRAHGLLTYADLSGKRLLEIMYFQPSSFLEVLAQAPEAERQAAMTALTDYLSAGDLPSEVVERYWSCSNYMKVFSDSTTPEAMALWETIQAAAGLE